MTGPQQPEFSPSALVTWTAVFLAGKGIELKVTPSMANVATIAAADLLRALGVLPASAPALPPEARR